MPATVTPALFPHLSYDLAKDVQPAMQLVWQYNALLVHPDVPAESLPDLERLLKKSPGKYSFASGGNGTPAHLAGELFKLRASVEAVHVPYKVFKQGVTDLIAGRVHFMFAAIGPTLGLVKSGKLKALAVLSPERLPVLPSTPTMVESGFPGFVVRDWQGIVVPGGTPKPVVERLNAELRKVIAQPPVDERLRGIGAEPVTGTPEEFGVLIRSEIERWGRLFRERGIAPG